MSHIISNMPINKHFNLDAKSISAILLRDAHKDWAHYFFIRDIHTNDIVGGGGLFPLNNISLIKKDHHCQGEEA